MDSSEINWDRLGQISDVLQGQWSRYILHALGCGIARPGELRRAASKTAGRHLSAKTLHEVLPRLIAAGLVTRSADRDARKTDYRLTPSGREILAEITAIGARGGWANRMDTDLPRPDVDPARRATPAGVWNYYLGGKDHFGPDREVAEAATAAAPSLPRIARQGRLVQSDFVQRLARAGVRQFIDIGTGLPVAGAVHEVAQAAAPESRVVYVDNDPRVLAHARALLDSTPEGACDYIEADLRNPEKILARASGTLDLSQPVAVMLISVLHFVRDEEDPWGIVTRLLDGIAGDAYLAVIHAADDLDPEGQALEDTYNAKSPVSIRMRSRDQVTRFFTGLEMIGPGDHGTLATLGRWFPDQVFSEGPPDMLGYAGLGRRPGIREPETRHR